MDQQVQRALDGQFGTLVLRNVGGDEFSDPELLKEVLDNRVGPQDELTQQSALVPAGLGDHPCGVLARPRVRSVFL